MSHELRTPLNAIIGFAEVMQQRLFGPVGAERYAGYVDDIHDAGKHLLSIINDILDLSKAETGKLALQEDAVDIVSVLNQCLRLLRDRAAEEGLRVSLAAPPQQDSCLRGDERLIKQAFLNVLNNAIKFTPTGGSITVTLEAGPENGPSVRFTDSGIGIAEADLTRVLEPFVQVESAFARKHGGTGLGLPLVKKIMELHGGRLAISSVLGAGTSVVLHFPVERIEAPPPAAPTVAQERRLAPARVA
jgi:signal transduction histidine kinase